FLLLTDPLLLVGGHETTSLDGSHARDLVGDRLPRGQCTRRDELSSCKLLRVAGDHARIPEVGMNVVKGRLPVAPLILYQGREADRVDHRLVQISRGTDLSCKVQFRIRPVNRSCRRAVVMDNTQLIGRQVSLSGE